MKELSIPIKRINGIFPISFKSPWYPPFSLHVSKHVKNFKIPPKYLISYDNGLLDIEKYSSSIAKKNGLNIKIVGKFTYRLGGADGYGSIIFSKYTPLYSNWNYFRLKSGGITGIGPSTPFGGFSIQWENTLFSKFRKTLSKKSSLHSYDALKNRKDYSESITLKGFPIILKEPRIEYPDIEDYEIPESLSMD